MDGSGQQRVDQQRVAGWLALTLLSDYGPLNGPRVSCTTDHGSLELTWRGGPTALEVAEHLLQAADPDLPVTRAADRDHPSIHPDSSELRRTSIEAGGIRVLLTATDPQDQRRRRRRDPISTLAVHQPPAPMQEDGHAADVVIWELPPEPGGIGMATVVRVPTALTESLGWTSDATIVAHLQYQPSPAAHPDRLARWRHTHQTAEVRFRSAAANWSTEDADSWLADIVTHPTQRPAFCTAVTWENRCLMRLRDGLRVHAAVETTPAFGFASKIPAAVLSALYRNHTPHHQRIPTANDQHATNTLAPDLPATLLIRCFGHGHDSERYRVRLDTTITVPAHR